MNGANTQLITAILGLSTSDIWAEAKREWKLSTVYFADDYETCLCGHFPIREVCVISNRSSQATAHVGNCCVANFLGLPSKAIFASLRRVLVSPEKSLAPELVEIAREKSWISAKDYDFYIDIMRMRKLSVKQAQWKRAINQRVVAALRK